MVIAVSKSKKLLNIPDTGGHRPILDSSNFIYIYLQLTRPTYVTKITNLSMIKLTLHIFQGAYICTVMETLHTGVFHGIFMSLVVSLQAKISLRYTNIYQSIISLNT